MDRIFNLDPQLLFDTGVTLVAMFFLFVLLSYLLFDPARKMLEKRKAFIQSQLDEAAETKADAMKQKEQYTEALSKVEEESAEMLAAARKKAKARETEIVEAANEQAHRILTRAEKEISLEKDKARDDMKQEMVQIASAMAGKFVSQSMTEEMQAQLIDETLEEMGDETWQK